MIIQFVVSSLDLKDFESAGRPCVHEDILSVATMLQQLLGQRQIRLTCSHALQDICMLL